MQSLEKHGGLVVAVALALAGCASSDPSTCHLDTDCSGGQVCNAAGVCETVDSVVGQACAREADCGAGQTCAVAPRDHDGDGTADGLGGVCAFEHAGVAIGTACTGDADCGAGACSLGRCAHLCGDASDCAHGSTCAAIPREVAGLRGTYQSCAPATGLLSIELPVDRVTGTVEIPVPSHALSFTLTSTVADPALATAFTYLESPAGETLYGPTLFPSDFWMLPMRLASGVEETSLMVPTSSRAPIENGLYTAKVRSFQPSGALATLTPRVRVIYRLGTEGHILDVNIHFMNLSGHACPDARLSAAAAADPSGPFMKDFISSWRSLYAPAGIALGNITFDDIRGQPDLDTVDAAELPTLFHLGPPGPPALDVYVVRSIEPLGVLTMVGGSPGPIARGAAHAGVVISGDAMCMHSWKDLGKIAARAGARYLGLGESIDVGGHLDLLDSTNDSPDNLLFYRLSGGMITDEQAAIMRRSPLLK